MLKAYHHWGDRFVDRLLRDVRVRDRRAGQRPGAARPRPAGHQAAVPGRDARPRPRSPRRCPRCWPAADVDTRIDPVALHHYLTFHAVVPPPRTILRGVRKLPPATLRGDRARRPQHRAPRTGSPTSAPRPDTPDWSERDWEDAVLGGAAGRRRPPAGRRRARSACLLSGGVDSSLIVGLLAEAGQTRAGDVLDRLRVGRRRRGRRVRLLRHHRRALRHRPPPDPHRHRPDAARARRRDRRDERADGQPRLRRLLPAQPGGRQTRQGGAVRAGRRRGVRRLPLVSPDGRTGRRLRRRLGGQPTAQAFFDRDTRGVGALRHDRLRRSPSDPSGRSSPSTSPARARRPASTARCGSTPTVMLVDDPVKRVDNMTMAWGLEGRVPFLDHELVELAATCPPELKIAHGGKGVLKAGRAPGDPGGGHRPPQGLLPGARAHPPRGSVPRPGPRRAVRAGRQGARAVPPRGGRRGCSPTPTAG